MYDYQALTDLLLDKIMGTGWSDYHLYILMFIILIVIILSVRRKKK